MGKRYIKGYINRTRVEIARSEGAMKQIKEGELAGLNYGLLEMDNDYSYMVIERYKDKLEESRKQEGVNNLIHLQGAIMGLTLVMEVIKRKEAAAWL